MRDSDRWRYANERRFAPRDERPFRRRRISDEEKQRRLDARDKLVAEMRSRMHY